MCFIIVSLFISTLILHVSGRNPALRIVGGSNVGENELPYVARIQIKLSIYQSPGIISKIRELHGCTCAILKPTWTLTAAHCISPQDLKIKGSFEKNGRIVKYKFKISHGPFEKNITNKIIEWMQHPAYKLVSHPTHVMSASNDIGLIKTEEIILTQYGHISAMDHTSLLGSEATATGYGLMKVEGEFADATSFGKPLQKLDVVVIKCSPSHTYVRPGLCIARRCGKLFSVTCPGDSGGPLVHPSGIIAVDSAGPSSGCYSSVEVQSFDMGIFTPISPYIDWISDVMNKDT
ncbi:granzyme M-like [Spodoptera litura]|uniref:Granzyme M-like n=1 Tax=Spodoptera litura TaxID=69820 RepID=A0A9J7EIV4_SPOLT|nr:granzyme M-like [Spodoptera litura]